MAEAPLETIRLHQANERTMLAWVRTGIAFMAFGFAIARFGLFVRQLTLLSPGVAHPPQSLESGWLGAALVGVGVLASVTASIRYAKTRAAIERGDVGAPSSSAVYALGAATALIGLAMALLLLRTALDFVAARARRGRGMMWGVLTRDQIEHAFERLDAELGARDCRAECYLVGGAVMCLALGARASTKDVDGWFTEPRVVRAAVERVAAELDLPSDWLNDAAKGFIPARAGFERWRSVANLDVSVADERTLLAMKCAAARTTEDAGDIRFLTTRLGLTTAEQVLAVVLDYFPPERLPVRTRLLIEEMFE